jgi:NAD(P)-dependent dehydrogenase (short-subunit alcohol dehydrogenase family)
MTEDGIEHHFQCNYLGHFLFTALIFPKLIEGSHYEPSRVINMGSILHHAQPTRLLDYNFTNRQDFNVWAGYGASKSALIQFTGELCRRANQAGANVVAFTVEPGGKASHTVYPNKTLV